MKTSDAAEEGTPPSTDLECLLNKFNSKFNSLTDYFGQEKIITIKLNIYIVLYTNSFFFSVEVYKYD